MHRKQVGGRVGTSSTGCRTIWRSTCLASPARGKRRGEGRGKQPQPAVVCAANKPISSAASKHEPKSPACNRKGRGLGPGPPPHTRGSVPAAPPRGAPPAVPHATALMVKRHGRGGWQQRGGGRSMHGGIESVLVQHTTERSRKLCCWSEQPAQPAAHRQIMHHHHRHMKQYLSSA